MNKLQLVNYSLGIVIIFRIQVNVNVYDILICVLSMLQVYMYAGVTFVLFEVLLILLFRNDISRRKYLLLFVFVFEQLFKAT